MCAAQKIAAEVAVGVAPDGVQVVHVVLRVVVLDEECWSLKPVVVRLAALCFAGPREVHVLRCPRVSIRSRSMPASGSGSRST